MTLLHGTSIAGGLCLLIIMAGYLVAGFMPAQGCLTRLAVANLAGLAWLVFGASVAGALIPLRGAVVWLLWCPVLFAWLIPATRRQLRADIRAVAHSTHFYAAAGGLALLWLALLLPFLVYPDLVFFDGKPNHDNFFWCVGAEYLLRHSYMAAPVLDRDHPLFNIAGAFSGWKPVWGRIGSESLLALAGRTVFQSPVQIYNFFVCSLALPWLLTVLAIARRLGGPALDHRWLALACFCQPVFFFFVANGNLPNLLGTIFGGGLWLLALLLGESRSGIRPLVAAGILFTHALVCCYPEILPFAFIPVGLLVGWRFFQAVPARAHPALLLVVIVVGGLCLNPLSTARAWNGFWNSIRQVQEDSDWANLFAPLTFAGYVPSLVTLSMPSVRLYGLIGGLGASLAVLASCFLLFKHSPRRGLLLVSLSGLAVMLLYTVANSFSYGWQKSVQFFGISLAVLFPFLLVGEVQAAFRHPGARWLPRAALLATLAVMVHGMLGNAADSLKSAGTKGLTQPLLALRKRVAAEFPGQAVYIDGASFRAAFFHSMWSARLFALNPLVFLPRQDQAGGYLRDSVRVADSVPPVPAGLYYVDADWARAFDYDAPPIMADRVGVLLFRHNLITEVTGFFRATGLPQAVGADFSLTIHPYADGWLEFTLAPNGRAAPGCRLEGGVTAARGVKNVTAVLDAQQHLVVRFPLQAGTPNVIAARIEGAPPLHPGDPDSPPPFQVLNVRTFRTPVD